MKLAIVMLAALAASRAPAAPLAGDAVRGEELYQACTDCHSLDKNDVGPRTAGSSAARRGRCPITAIPRP